MQHRAKFNWFELCVSHNKWKVVAFCYDHAIPLIRFRFFFSVFLFCCFWKEKKFIVNYDAVLMLFFVVICVFVPPFCLSSSIFDICCSFALLFTFGAGAINNKKLVHVAKITSTRLRSKCALIWLHFRPR